MFVTPMLRTYRYSFVIQLTALVPIALGILIVAVVPSSDPSKAVFIATSVTLIAIGILILVWFRKQRISIYEEGISSQSLFGAKEIRWSDVVEFRYFQTSLAQDIALHFGLIGYLLTPFVGKKTSSKKGTQTLKIVSSNKTSIKIDAYYKDGKDAIRTVLERVHPRLLDDARRKLQQGANVQFGKLMVSATGIQWKSKATLGFADIQEVGVSGRNFRVKASGKWLDAISVPCNSIPNVFVALDLIRERMQQGTTADAKSFAAYI